jgi:hypothetical protein
VARTLYLTVVMGALLTLSAWAFAAAPPADRGATNAASREGALADDDADTALFQLTDLTPGQAESRCITVTNDGPAPDGMRLSGSADGSGLDEFLHLTVDAGSGGHFGDCSGFTGTAVFDGSLGDFVELHHDYDSGLVALTPSQSATTTFRLRVALDDVPAAQGGTATASFAWETRSDAIAVVPPPPRPSAPEQVPGDGDADGSADPQLPAAEDEKRARSDALDSGSRDPEAGDRPAPDTPDANRPELRAAPDAPPGTPGGPGLPPSADEYARAGGGQAQRDASPPRRRAKQPAPPATAARETPAAARRSTAADDDRGLIDGVIRAIAEAIRGVAPVVERTAVPLILLILGGLFLLIQNRIDRRDPKLARAPLHAQPDLPFLPPPFPGDDRS